MLSSVNEYQGLRHIIEETATLKARKEALEASQDFILIAFHYSQRKRGAKWRPSLLLSNQHIFLKVKVSPIGNPFSLFCWSNSVSFS